MDEIKGFRKKNKGDHVLWSTDRSRKGVMEFTFDGKVVFNLFRDYPEKLTKRQKKIFDEENPYWAEFFGEEDGDV